MWLAWKGSSCAVMMRDLVFSVVIHLGVRSGTNLYTYLCMYMAYFFFVLGPFSSLAANACSGIAQVQTHDGAVRLLLRSSMQSDPHG